MLRRPIIQTAAVARPFLFRTRIAASDNTKWRQSYCFSTLASPSSDDDMDEDIASSTKPVDFFNVLNIPRRFTIDEDEIKSNYRRLMNELHPDKHSNNISGKSLDELQQIEDQASQVTQAYQILKYPHERAMHLLELVEHPMDETSNGNLVGGAFLMEMMELRESIDNLVVNDTDGNCSNREKLQELILHIKDEITKLCEEFDNAFQEQNYQKAIELTAKLQYWNRIEETINEKL